MQALLKQFIAVMVEFVRWLLWVTDSLCATLLKWALGIPDRQAAGVAVPDERLERFKALALMILERKKAAIAAEISGKRVHIVLLNTRTKGPRYLHESFATLLEAVDFVTTRARGRGSAELTYFHVFAEIGARLEEGGLLQATRSCLCWFSKEGCGVGRRSTVGGLIGAGGLFVAPDSPLPENEVLHLDTGFAGELLVRRRYLDTNFDFHPVGFMTVGHVVGNATYLIGFSESFPWPGREESWVVCHVPVGGSRLRGPLVGAALLGECCIALRQDHIHVVAP